MNSNFIKPLYKITRRFWRIILLTLLVIAVLITTILLFYKFTKKIPPTPASPINTHSPVNTEEDDDQGSVHGSEGASSTLLETDSEEEFEKPIQGEDLTEEDPQDKIEDTPSLFQQILELNFEKKFQYQIKQRDNSVTEDTFLDFLWDLGPTEETQLLITDEVEQFHYFRDDLLNTILHSEFENFSDPHFKISRIKFLIRFMDIMTAFMEVTSRLDEFSVNGNIFVTTFLLTYDHIYGDLMCMKEFLSKFERHVFNSVLNRKLKSKNSVLYKTKEKLEYLFDFMYIDSSESTVVIKTEQDDLSIFVENFNKDFYKFWYKLNSYYSFVICFLVIEDLELLSSKKKLKISTEWLISKDRVFVQKRNKEANGKLKKELIKFISAVDDIFKAVKKQGKGSLKSIGKKWLGANDIKLTEEVFGMVYSLCI